MADPTVASTVRAMRRAGAAGEPVSADVVQGWAATFLTQLYAEPEDVMHSRRRNLQIRALYLHPPAGKHKEHR